MDKTKNAINYDKKILSRNLRYLVKRHKLDFEKVNIARSTFNNYINRGDTPPIATVIRIMTLLKNPHESLTLDQLVFKDLIPKDKNALFNKNKYMNLFTRKSKRPARERENITEKEFEELQRPHSAEDIAWINAEDGKSNEDHDSYVNKEEELTSKDLRQIDKACTAYLESVGKKELFNPNTNPNYKWGHKSR
jgi:hypothetical protein